MKLRLPHQFQAALLAAIASVSLTTLSTGTAYATTLEDAALGLDDFTQASVDAAKAEGWSFSDTGIATESGVYTTTAASTTITSSTPWTTTATGGRAVYAALMTIDVSSLSTNGGVLLTSTRNDGKAREGIGYDYTGGTYKVESAWEGAKRGDGLINQNLMNYADANGLVTVAIIYKGNQGTTGATIFVANQTKNDKGLKGDDNTTGNPKMLLANTTGVKYTNLYMFGMTDGDSITDADMQSMMKEAGAYYWNGSTDATWSTTSTNWNHYGSSVGVSTGAGNAKTNVVFGADAVKNVVVADSITVGDMTVEGAGYAFTVANGAKLTVAGNASIASTIALEGGTLSLNTATVTGPFTSYDAFDDGQGNYFSKGASGFQTRDYQGYLVKGGEGAQGTSISGSVTGAEKTDLGSTGDIVVKFAKGSDTIYYVNEIMSYASDMSTATDFVIKKGAMLSANGTATMAQTLHGEGTFALASGQQTLNSGLNIGSDWTGAVRVSGTFRGLNISTLSNINSTIELAGMEGYLSDPGTNATLTLSRDVIFTNAGANNAAIHTTDGYSRTGGVYEFAGSASGDGTIWIAGGPTQHYAFSGDVSAWNGLIKVTNAGSGNDGSWVKFTGNAKTVNVEVNKSGGDFRVIADTDATFNKSIVADKLEITTGHTATVKNTLTAQLKGPGNLVVDNGGYTATVNGVDSYTGSVTVDSGTLALGANAVIGGSLTINEGGLVTTERSNRAGFVAGDVTINAGGTLKVVGSGQDAFGYSGGNYTDNIVMTGAAGEGNGALLELAYTSANSATMTTNLDMRGYAAVKGRAINSFGGNITASNTDNTIDTLSIRSNVTVTVTQDGSLAIGSVVRHGTDGNDGNQILTKEGAGSLSFTGAAAMKGLTHNAGTTTFNGALAVAGDVTVNGGSVSVGADGGAEVSGLTTVGTGGTLTNAGELTLNGLTLDGSFTNTGSLTLGGTVTLATGNSIVNNTGGTVAFDNSVAFDLTHLQATNQTYTLFTGSAGVNLTSLNGEDVLSHITGNVITTGRSWTFGTDGTLSYTINSRDLVWKMAGGAGVWTTDTNETPWEEMPPTFPPQYTHFNDGDAVTFAFTANPAVATLGSDVTVSTMTLDNETPNVTVNNEGNYAFNVDELLIQSGTLTTNTAINVKAVTIGSAGVWNVGRDLDLTTVGSFSNEGVLRVLDGVELRVHKGSTAESAGTVTADAGGTLYVDNGGGQGDAGYTYHGVESAPFKGTLVYDVVSSGNHDVSIALDNTFQGTLELRGRLAASASNFGGMTKLVLNGDRGSNTTGLWNQNALTLNVPVDIVGENTVDLYTSAALTINGTVNGGTEKQGHLGKQNDGALTFNGAVALKDFTAAAGTVNFNSSAALDRININGGTVNLGGGADADYNMGDIYLYSGTLAIGNNGVKSISANEFRVSCTTTLNNAAAAPAVINAVQLDVSNFQTNFTLRNVTLNVSGRATAAELRTDRNADEATVTVGDNATLNLNGGVLWKKTDGAKTDYVNLTIANGGTVAITGAENVLNALTIERGGALTFGAGTSTTVEGTATISEVITALGDITLNGNVNIDGMDDTELTTYVYGKENGNGFKQYGGSLTVVNTTGGGSVSVKEGTVITFKDASGTLDSTGKFTLDSSTVNYDTFCVLANGTSESLTYALSKAEGHGTMTTVQLANGTTLDMDSADAVLQHLVLKGGASATLNVTESATIGSLEGLGAAQALNVTGTAGKVLSISTTETMAGALSVTDATLKLNTNLTLAGGLDNAGTIDLYNKALTLNGQEGGTAYTMGKLTNGASSDVTLNNHVAATFDGEATVWRLTGNAGSSVVVGENATLTLASTNRNYYSQVSDLDVKGTISLKGSNGDIRFYGYEDNQVFNLGHLHIDGNSGTTYMLTAGSVNYSTDIVVKSLSGGGANHTLQVSDCYNGGSQGMVIDLIIGETQDSANLYTGKIQYGIGTGSALAGSGMNLVIKDELVASKAVLDPVFSGNNAQSANITVDTAHAQVKGLTGTVNNARTMQVSGTEAGKNRVLEIVGEGNYTYGGKLGANLDVVHSGTGTQSFGGVDGFDGSLDVEAGTLNIMNIAQATSLSVQDVTIKNSTLGVYTNATAAEANEGTLTIKDGHTLTASGANAKLNANLVMESGSTLDVSAYGGTGGLHMGSSITLNPGMFLSDKDMEGVSGLGFMDAYDLKYGVDEFFIGSTQYSEITFASETWVKASEVFSNDGFKDGKDYYVFYSGANPGGNGSNVGTIYIVQVPEPTTSTLNLLALCALAARRRRKA